MRMTDVWTKEDYEYYAQQLRLIEDAYGASIPHATMERMAADIVNRTKAL